MTCFGMTHICKSQHCGRLRQQEASLGYITILCLKKIATGIYIYIIKFNKMSSNKAKKLESNYLHSQEIPLHVCF